jgi:hypothetical protein
MMDERTVMQEALFHGFSLEDHVPADHLLRSIERFVDWAGLREHLRPFYSETGRPSIDPDADDPDADRRLLHGDPVGAAAVRRGTFEPCVSLVDRSMPSGDIFLPDRHWRGRYGAYDQEMQRRVATSRQPWQTATNTDNWVSAMGLLTNEKDIYICNNFCILK